MSGQLSIRWIERRINYYLNKMLKTNTDYVVASDTDSIYVELKGLVDMLGGDKATDEIVDIIDQFAIAKIEPYIDSCYQELAGMMGAYQQKMKMKRETIANKGIWKKKKIYILNAWDIEGVRFKEPQLKMSGIEAVRSSTPQSCRSSIKAALGIIMNGSEQELIDYIENFHKEFINLKFEEVAFPRGIKNMEKYRDAATIYKKATPIQVKGALLFNHWLKENKIQHIAPIQNGDKIRFAYLKQPNLIHESVIAVPDELPEEMDLDRFIDREMQFEKAFLGPVKTVANIIGWNTEKTSTLEDFFA
jgi:DNA polymerase elongation subunit (family B)